MTLKKQVHIFILFILIFFPPNVSSHLQWILKWEYLELYFCSSQHYKTWGTWNRGRRNDIVILLIVRSDTATESTCSNVGLHLRRGLVLIGCFSSHPVFDLLWPCFWSILGGAISCTRTPLLGWHGDDWHSADSPQCLPTNGAKSPDECYCKIGPPPYLETSELRLKTTPLSNGVL